MTDSEIMAALMEAAPFLADLTSFEWSTTENESAYVISAVDTDGNAVEPFTINLEDGSHDKVIGTIDGDVFKFEDAR